jgi:crossover junction endodeoxyribonuclease RusA
MLKPILDALKGLVYVDDSQITDVIGRKREIHGDFTIWHPSPILLASIKKGVDFVCVQVEMAV